MITLLNLTEPQVALLKPLSAVNKLMHKRCCDALQQNALKNVHLFLTASKDEKKDEKKSLRDGFLIRDRRDRKKAVNTVGHDCPPSFRSIAGVKYS